MNDLTIQSVSFTYSSLEDRLLARCIVDGQTHELWLARRMLKILIPALVQWLVKSGVDSVVATDFFRGSTRSSQQNLHPPEPVKHLSTAPLQKRPNNIQLVKWQTSAATDPISSQWLCSKANLTTSDELMRVQLISDKSELVYQIKADILDTGRLLAAMIDSLKEAGWDLEFPAWLEEHNGATPKPQTSFLH